MALGKPSYKPLTLTPVNVSLTEGTNIPAPLDSPPDTPRPPTPGKGPLSSHPTPISATFPGHPLSPRGQDSTYAASAMSPTSTTGRRPSSVRKFLGLRRLSSYDSFSSDRPASPSTLGGAPSLSRKRSNGWFNKRKSSYGIPTVSEAQEKDARPANGVTQLKPVPEKKGPPPPALPELTSFGVSKETLSLEADDLFKDIK